MNKLLWVFMSALVLLFACGEAVTNKPGTPGVTAGETETVILKVDGMT